MYRKATAKVGFEVSNLQSGSQGPYTGRHVISMGRNCVNALVLMHVRTWFFKPAGKGRLITGSETVLLS